MSYSNYIRQRLSETAMTQTPQFKAWFRNSKVVDRNGNPLVVYHGTNADIHEFDPNRAGQRWDIKDFGVYFTGSPGMASEFADFGGRDPHGANVIPAYLSLQNPLGWRDVMWYEGWGDEVYTLDDKVVRDWAKKEMDGRHMVEYYDYRISPLEWKSYVDDGKHDGVALLDPDGGRNSLFVALHPNQIKSVFSQQFDPNSPRLSESRLKSRLGVTRRALIDAIYRLNRAHRNNGEDNSRRALIQAYNNFMSRLSPPIIVYRGMAGVSINEVDWNNLGTSWTLNPDAAVEGGALLQVGNGRRTIMVQAQVNPDQIDMDTTLVQNLTVYEEEEEIRLWTNTPVRIICVTDEQTGSEMRESFLANTGSRDTEEPIERMLGRYLTENDEDYEEEDHEVKVQRVIDTITPYAAQNGVEIICQSYARNGIGAPVVLMTDLNAEQPGSGGGTKTMMELARLADHESVTVVTHPASPRNKQFYERFGFEMSGQYGPSGMARYPALPQGWDE